MSREVPVEATVIDVHLVVEQPLWHNGLNFHEVGLIVCAAFGLFAICLSFFLIFQHATHYSKPDEQKQYVETSQAARPLTDNATELFALFL